MGSYQTIIMGPNKAVAANSVQDGLCPWGGRVVWHRHLTREVRCVEICNVCCFFCRWMKIAPNLGKNNLGVWIMPQADLVQSPMRIHISWDHLNWICEQTHGQLLRYVLLPDKCLNAWEEAVLQPLRSALGLLLTALVPSLVCWPLLNALPLPLLALESFLFITKTYSNRPCLGHSALL